MGIHLYLSLTPEALIASMLPPAEFGSYLAVGTKKRTRGQAIFFELEGYHHSPSFDLEGAEKKCAPHPDGQPKHSVYVSIYRVLEQVPLNVIGNLFLVTRDGRVLEIRRGAGLPDSTARYHLYQELCPVHPRIVSTLDPREFTRYITSEGNPLRLPKICFVDLRLGDLGEDPGTAALRDLPYNAVEHLRDCVLQLRDNPAKHTKTVDRVHPQAFPYRTVETGVYVGGGTEVGFYPFPPESELQSTYYEWWRSASIMGDTPGL